MAEQGDQETVGKSVKGGISLDTMEEECVKEEEEEVVHNTK